MSNESPIGINIPSVPKELDMNGFVIDKFIGSGSFGNVYLLKRNNSEKRILKISIIPENFQKEIGVEPGIESKVGKIAGDLGIGPIVYSSYLKELKIPREGELPDPIFKGFSKFEFSFGESKIPGIPKIYMEYIIQEYIPGSTLEDDPTKNSEKARKDIKGAMELYHRLLIEGYDHGDLFPRNVIYSDEKKRYYLIDYGCSKYNPLYLQKHSEMLIKKIERLLLTTEQQFIDSLYSFANSHHQYEMVPHEIGVFSYDVTGPIKISDINNFAINCETMSIISKKWLETSVFDNIQKVKVIDLSSSISLIDFSDFLIDGKVNWILLGKYSVIFINEGSTESEMGYLYRLPKD